VLPTVLSTVTCRQPRAWHTHWLACRLAFKPEALAADRNCIVNGPYFLRTRFHPEEVRLQPLCLLARNGKQDTNKPVGLDCTVALPARSSQPAAHIALTFCIYRLRHPSKQLFANCTGLDISSLTRVTRFDGSDMVLHRLIPTDKTSALPVLPTLSTSSRNHIYSLVCFRWSHCAPCCLVPVACMLAPCGEDDLPSPVRPVCCLY